MFIAMKRPPVFSPSQALAPAPATQQGPDEPAHHVEHTAPARWRGRLAAGLSGLLLIVGLSVWWFSPGNPTPPPEPISQVFERMLLDKGWPSPARPAVDQVAGSVVRVQSFGPHPKHKGQEEEMGVGTGVVITEEGMILTNLHVVWGSQRLLITFADGTESEARVVAPTQQRLGGPQAAENPRRFATGHHGLKPTGGTGRCRGGDRFPVWHGAIGVIRCGLGAEPRIQNRQRRFAHDRADPV